MGVRHHPASVTPPVSTADTYAGLLARLLPPGVAWMAYAGSRWRGVLSGLAAELARIHNRGRDLLDEIDPRTTDELLAAWERIADLPSTGTTDERRAALRAALTAYGGQSASYLEGVCERGGFTVQIDAGNDMEMQPFRCGLSGCDEPIRGIAWGYAFVVHASSGLTTAQKATLAALIDRYRPLHSAAHYLYDL